MRAFVNQFHGVHGGRVYQVLLKTLDFMLKIAFLNKLLLNVMGCEYIYIYALQYVAAAAIGEPAGP